MSDSKKHWEQIYSAKAPLEVSWYQKNTTLSIQFIRNTHIALDAPIIDVGGGASVLVDNLSDQGYSNISVLDISSTAIKHAQERLGRKASKIEWFIQDITQFAPPHNFSLWHDRAVFHFLTEKSERDDYVKAVKRTLDLDGHLIIAAFAIGGPAKCSGLSIVQYDAKRLLAELGDEFNLVEEMDELHMTPANKQQKFSYFRFVRQFAETYA